MRRHVLPGAALLAVAVLLAVFAFTRDRGSAAATGLEIAWQQGHIVLQGRVRDAATQALLADAAQARLGGSAEQVYELLDIDPQAPALLDAAALGALMQLGSEGWRLRWDPPRLRIDGTVESPAQRERVRALAAQAFGSGTALTAELPLSGAAR